MSTELDESEKYAILANIPYLINEGVPIDTLQSELKEYGLDYTIDKELTDNESAVLTNDKEAIHSIRGTSLNIIDLLEDLKLGLTSQQIMTTLAAKPHITAGLGKEIPFLSMNYIPDSQKVMAYLKSVAPKGYKRMIPKTINPEVRSMSKVKTPIQLVKSLYGLPFVIGGVSKIATEASSKLFNAIYDSKSRHTIESDKHQKIKDKYPNRELSLASHSLGGSIANHISRIEGTKSISFNPAPSHLNKDSLVKDSKVYRTFFDPVSYIRGDDEPEKIITLPQKHFEPHGLRNFIPPKITKKIIPEVERQKAFVEGPPKKCLENPELPECRSYYYI